MSNLFLAEAVKFLAKLVLGSDVFARVLASVQRWEEKEVAGLEKKTGVLKELEILGLNLAGRMANLAIELAVAYVGYKAGNNPAPTKDEMVKKAESTVLNTFSDSTKK